MESVSDNPVLIREFRSRIRGIKGFLIMGGYALVMVAVMLIAYYFMWQNSSGQSLVSSKLGQSLFVAVAWAQVVLLTILAPSLTAGSLSQEIEKKTVEMLVLTRLSAGKIVLGKQLSGFLFAMMLLISSLPVSGICLMLGGISPAEIAITYVLLMGWAYLLTCVSVFCSSLNTKTANASGNSVGLSFLYFLFTSGSGTAVMAMSRFAGGRAADVPCSIVMNPAWGPYFGLMSCQICGLSIPVAAVALIYHISVGAMLLLVASTHVKYLRVERALSIRLLLLGISVFSAWLSAGSVGAYARYPGASVNTLDSLGQMATMILINMIFAAAVFGTGVIRKKLGQSIFPYATDARKAFKSDVGGAIPFLLLWTVITYGVYGATFAKAMALAHTPLDSTFWPAYTMIGVSLCAIVFGLTGVALLASTLAKKRNAAAALVILFAVVMFAGYGIILLNKEVLPPGMQNAAALWPMTPILAATGNFFAQSAPTLHWVKNSAAFVTGGVYILIALLALGAAGLTSSKNGGVVDE
jgi:ABC-type transport system involved in multi-copper enzyme maturation permease subunit